MPDNIQNDLDGGTDEALSALTLVLNATDGGTHPARRQAKNVPREIRATRVIMYVIGAAWWGGSGAQRVTVKTIEGASRCQTKDAESDEVPLMVA